MRQLTMEEAIRLAESGVWRSWSHYERVKFQLFQKRLCMDFDAFHESIEKVLGRPVFTHEFGLNYDRLVMEFLGDTTKPSFEDIVNLIPEDKRMTILIKGE